MASTHQTSDPSTLRPWQFFTLLALSTSTAAVLVVRGASPAAIILICLAIGAAALVGLGALRTLRPLVSIDAFEPEMLGGRTRAALEREKNLVLRSIKELEFDHAMGKVSTPDFDEMTARLRARAVRLLGQLDSAETAYRQIIERELASRLGKAGAVAAGSLPDGSASEQRAEGRGQSAEGRGQWEEPSRSAEHEGGGKAHSAGFCAACGTARDLDARFCKRCGAKLLLAMLAVLAFGGSARAQSQMPDLKQMSGIPLQVSDLPDGHMSVRVIRGALSNDIPNQPVELHGGATVVTVKTDESGRADFSGIAGGTPVHAVAVVDGERVESQPFPAPTQGGVRLLLVAAAGPGGALPAPSPPVPGRVVFGDQTQIVFEFDGEALNVFYLLDIQNGASAPVNPVSPLILDLPRDAQGTSVIEGAPQASAVGNRVMLSGPFAAGRTSVQVGFQLPYSGGDLTLVQELPIPSTSLTVAMKKTGDMSVTSPQLTEPRVQQLQGGPYVMAQSLSLAGGSTLTLNLSGLPHHSPVPRLIALTLACAIVAGGFWAAAKVPPQGADPARLTQLKSRREKLFGELVRLERQRQAGSLEKARYAERRPALITQLERVYRELDTEGGKGLAA